MLRPCLSVLCGRERKPALPFLTPKYEKLSSFYNHCKGKGAFNAPFPLPVHYAPVCLQIVRFGTSFSLCRTGSFTNRIFLIVYVVDCNALNIYLLDGKILLGNLNLCGTHVLSGIAHDIGILIYKEYVIGLNTGLNVCIVGAVPCGLG